MFFGMTAWLFFRRDGRLSVVVASLMTLLGLQCFCSMWFILEDVYLDPYYWKILTSIDIVAVPFYALILKELVRPGSVSRKVSLANVLPFAVIGILYAVTGASAAYWIMIAGAGVYGVYYLIWTHFNIIRYNRQLKEQYSFTENIDLDWLRKILWFFFALLAIWIVDTVCVHADMDCFYLTASMVMWMIIDYFIYRHEAVMESLCSGLPEVDVTAAEATVLSELGVRIERLFNDEQVFLNPNLKISDIAAAVGSNRTYVSTYFNREAASTFYDYVNGLRVSHACRLLRDTDWSVKVIAEKSGYNSPQAFIRVFTKTKGISPTDFRASGCD